MSHIAIPQAAFEKLLKRVVKLRYPPHAALTPEQVERHYRHLEFACTVNPHFLVEDTLELLDKLEPKQT